MIDLLGMQRAVWRSARTTTEKIVLLAIADFYSDRSPEPWPSVPTLAERCSLGRTAVLEAIAALERDGVLVVRRVLGRPNRYDLSHVTPLLVRMATPKVATTHDSGPEHAVARLVMEALQWDDDANQSATQTSSPDRRDQSVRRTGPVHLADGPRAPTIVTARCPKLPAIRACAPSSCCLLLDTQWQTSSGSPRTCQSKLAGAAETGRVALVACPSKSFREHLASAMRGRGRFRRRAATQAVRKEGFIGTRCSRTLKPADTEPKFHERRSAGRISSSSRTSSNSAKRMVICI